LTRYPKLEDVLIYEGQYFIAEWYYTESGQMPAYAYYQEMSETDQQRFDYVAKYFCENRPGLMLPRTIYRAEDAAHKIYAFKPGAQRFFNFTTEGAKVIVTNAYRKHSDQMTKQDLEHLKLSARYRDDYRKRVQEMTYYEN